MKIIKQAIRNFINYTFLGYLVSFRLGHVTINKKNALKKYQLYNIIDYWRKNNINNTNQEKVILISNLRDAHTLSNKLFSIIGMLSTRYNIKVIAVSDFGNAKAYFFLKNYCSNLIIESIYSSNRSYIINLKTLYYIIKNFKKILKLDSIKIFNNNISDLVYDEYLRVTGLPTIKSADFLYFSIVFKGIYLYLRYRELFIKYNISDVVLGLDIYTKAMHIRVGAEFGANKWQTYNYSNPMFIRRTPCTYNYTYRPLIYEQKHSNFIEKFHSKDEIELLFNDLFIKRYAGKPGSLIHEKDLEVNKNKLNDIENLKLSIKDHYNERHKTIVIFSHVFVDAVTSTGWTLYKDYYIWLIETLKICNTLKNTNILVKPHPIEKKYNLVVSAKDVVKEFNNEYSANVGLIDISYSNYNILSISDLILTQTGSIGLEASALGKKVICASANWYKYANSVFTAKTEKEYKNLILNFEKLSLDQNQINEAKKCFVWNANLMHGKADFISKDIDSFDFQSLDKLYKTSKILKDQPVYRFVETDTYN